MKSRTTIQDVAKKAMVSKVTVSYVLNGRDADVRISQETRARVLQAAEELGYRPSGVARMLVNQRSGTIAVVFQYASYFSHWSSFTSDVMRGVCEAAVVEGFDLMLHTKATETVDQELNQLLDGRVDGALVLRDGNDPMVQQLINRGFPFVLFFTRNYDPRACFVDSDNYMGGQIATDHLIKLGHQRIGMVRGSHQSTSSNDRFNGYRDALESNGIPCREDHVLAIPTPDSPLGGLDDLMARPDRPTAFFIWSDDVAYPVMARLKELGFECPRDVSIVGFDSLPSSELCSPRLTSVKQAIEEIARAATQMLVARINGEDIRQRQQIFPLTLDIRSSTGPAPDLT